MEVAKLNIVTALDITKTVNHLFFKNTGVPISLLPPGMIKAAANAKVANKVAMTMQEDVVSFIHFSPSFLNYLCFMENNSLGVFPSLIFISNNGCDTIFSTS
ncbi:Hypothetical predicted protein [Olea europaea subsp. europaea]|uniref:Uncharacterized protein n=1 Tax=Olea europaea subsp. europaea TaxID=158383 RepID=A0A8S0PMH5_OLEEU|nr:Hypothetical predicted protein [Olea europaea subsp. europaea]